MVVIRLDNLSLVKIPNSFKNSNTYVIMPDGSNLAWLVDIGDFHCVEEVLGGRSVAGVFVTHAHLDHIYGINELCRKFPECRVYGSGLCLEFLGDDRRNLSFYYERPLKFSHPHCVAVNEGDSVALVSGLDMAVMATPGHTPDSICFLTPSMIFTGDAYIPGAKPVTKLKGGDRVAYAASVERIKTVLPGRLLLPGHTVKQES